MQRCGRPRRRYVRSSRRCQRERVRRSPSIRLAAFRRRSLLREHRGRSATIRGSIVRCPRPQRQSGHRLQRLQVGLDHHLGCGRRVKSHSFGVPGIPARSAPTPNVLDGVVSRCQRASAVHALAPPRVHGAGERFERSEPGGEHRGRSMVIRQTIARAVPAALVAANHVAMPRSDRFSACEALAPTPPRSVVLIGVGL
jgi:hypothetical protein